jgi:hypothetical protein
MGNLLSQDPDEIFNSPRMQKQRDDQINGDFGTPEICRNCVETHDTAKRFWQGAQLVPIEKL